MFRYSQHKRGWNVYKANSEKLLRQNIVSRASTASLICSTGNCSKGPKRENPNNNYFLRENKLFTSRYWESWADTLCRDLSIDRSHSRPCWLKSSCAQSIDELSQVNFHPLSSYSVDSLIAKLLIIWWGMYTVLAQQSPLSLTLKL